MFSEQPGLWFVLATMLPLASFVVLLLAGAKRNFLRQYRDHALGGSIYRLMGGDNPVKWPAFVATAAIALAFVCCLIGFITYLGENETNHKTLHQLEKDLHALHDKASHAAKEADQKKAHKEIEEKHEQIHALEHRWSGRFTWASVLPERGQGVDGDGNWLPPQGTILELGFRIDMLSAVMFVMVTFIATLIHLFSMGYMHDELKPVYEDHDVHTEGGHLHRRGRFGRFFMFLSLFCFSMLNLLLADNLFQIFVSWELVGVCSFLLIGFYYERHSASTAANKAFITNRVGDAGFIIGLLIIWTNIGSFNFEEIFRRIRCPDEIAHRANVPEAGRIVSVDRIEPTTMLRGGEKATGWKMKVKEPGERGTDVLLFPRTEAHFHMNGPGTTVTLRDHPGPTQMGHMPYWMLVVAGLGIFLGCVGKSAQFPLQVWLPDAMEGPTPVSALIHAATMVAAGVYLVGRSYPLFTPEVLLTIAYVGGITLFVAATTAVVMTDIKKVLAYSTVSQLGYMMLALGVGGWVAGLFHLLTHAFFKALMFLASGSVIYGCHHVQEMTRYGGLHKKMKITALTMLMGVLAISGVPLFSGWYSKDAILANSLGFSLEHPQHFLLFILPLLTAGLTTFYMFRMWFMTFAGAPKDHHVYDHAHESPRIMTIPLILLAILSVTVAWGWPMWDPTHSWLEHQLHHAQPASVMADFAPESHMAHEVHDLAGLLALALVAVGLAFASVLYYFKGVLDPVEAKDQFPGVHSFLSHKWYFDEFYSAAVVRPSLTVAGWCKNFDTYAIDGLIHSAAKAGMVCSTVHGWFDRYVVDGIANLLARVSYGVGSWMRGLQTGYLRSYVLFLVLAAVGIWVVLALITSGAASGGMGK